MGVGAVSGVWGMDVGGVVVVCVCRRLVCVGMGVYVCVVAVCVCGGCMRVWWL